MEAISLLDNNLSDDELYISFVPEMLQKADFTIINLINAIAIVVFYLILHLIALKIFVYLDYAIRFTAIMTVFFFIVTFLGFYLYCATGGHLFP